MIERLLAVLTSGQRAAAEKALEDPSVAGIVVWRRPDLTYVLQAFDDDTDTGRDLSDPPEPGCVRIGWWAKEVPEEQMDFRTRRAAEWWEKNPSASGREAAAKFGVSPSAVYKFAADRKKKPICPACGQVVRAGFKQS